MRGALVRGAGLGLGVLGVLVSCAGGDAPPSGSSGGVDAGLASSAHRVTPIARAFRVVPQVGVEFAASHRIAPHDALRGAVATGFTRDGERYLPVIAANEPAIHRARVELPSRASAAFHVADATSGLAMHVTMLGASDAAAQIEDGYLAYENALSGAPGAHVIHRPHAEGTEDYVTFDAAPSREAIEYAIALDENVAGVRVVERTIELLDAHGAPRLRMAPPWFVDADGVRREADVTVSGCAFDTSPRAPYGRPTVAPSSRTCTVAIAWHGAKYPMMIDPSWTTTGSLATARFAGATAVMLDGRVLAISGWTGGASTAAVEIYDPTTSTWTATGSATDGHTWGPGAATFANGLVFTGAGYGVPSGFTTVSETYNPSSGTWTALASALAAHHDCANQNDILLNDGRVFFAACRDASTTFSAVAEIYDPTSNTWTLKTPAPIGLNAAAIFRMADGTMMLTQGGTSAGANVNSYLYNATTDTWAQTGSTGDAHSSATGALLAGGKLLVAGGGDSRAEVYDPAAGTWSFVPGNLTGLQFTTARRLSSGMVILAGDNTTAGTNLYDPTGNALSSGGNMTMPHYQPFSAVLANGTVLVAGGGSPVTAVAEIFNPSLAQGASCTQNSQCGTGNCIDGVCCDTTCGGGVAGDCQACSVAAGASVNGTCASLTGSSCNDGNACTQTDTCQAGVCTGGNPVVCTASDQCHGVGVCNTSTGLCSNPSLPNGTTCSDGNACTQTDTCQAGVCTGGNPVVCTPSDSCHFAGTCSPATGVCSSPPVPNGTVCNDGNGCTQTDTCQSGICAGGNPVVCTPSDQCHLAGTCNPANGTCSNPNANDGTACNDGNACTKSDACQAGVCTGSNPVVCTASDQCHAAGTCNPANGTCSNPNATNGTACSDGNACTQKDTCQAGVCTGSNPVICTASDQCHVAGGCNTTTGVCSNPPAANGTTCNDGVACTKQDVCTSGSCGGTTYTCAPGVCQVASACDGTGGCNATNAPPGTACPDDGNPCTADTCNASGSCTHANVADGTSCGSGKICVAGVCSNVPSDGGAPDAGDGGATDGGATDGGATDGGATDGGATDGGATDGGATDGGATDGGATDGGATDGGATDSGATDGGATDSGAKDSGSADASAPPDAGHTDAGGAFGIDSGSDQLTPLAVPNGGCGCKTAGSARSGAAGALLGLLGLVVVVARRRKR
jgi:MYXO-CTERM domain-containing protein